MNTDRNAIDNLFKEFHYADDLGVIKSKLTEYVITVRQEVRAGALRDAANIVSRLPVHVSRSGVKKGSDINGWSSAINQSVIALEAAAASTRKDNEHHG